MVVALVALAVRRMEGHVRDHAPVDQLRADPVFDQGVPVGGTQLGGQRHGDFAGDLGILPGLDRLDRVPQRRTVMRPVGRPGGVTP